MRSIRFEVDTVLVLYKLESRSVQCCAHIPSMRSGFKSWTSVASDLHVGLNFLVGSCLEGFSSFLQLSFLLKKTIIADLILV